MTASPDIDVDHFRAVAADAALISGRIQKARLGTHLGIENKGELDLVTEVDRAYEVAIVARLRRSFPSHDVVAEESAPSLTGSAYVWYVDPLDGTTNYAHNYPFFCTSVALFDRYVGKELPEGTHSLAFTLTFRADDRSLQDAEVDAFAAAAVQGAGERFDAQRR